MSEKEETKESENSEPEVKVEINTPEPEPEPEPEPAPVVVVESPEDNSVEAATVAAAVDNAEDVGALKILVATQAEEIDNLKLQLAAVAEGTSVALQESEAAVQMAAEAMEPEVKDASEDEEPKREHWWYR